MKNRNFGDSQHQPQPKEPLTQGTALTATRRQHHPGEVLTTATLTEPLFQDLNHTSRFFVDYFSKRVCPTLVFHDRPDNPYRGIIACASSPVVASAIVAVAACHDIQSLTGRPMARLPLPTTSTALAVEAPFNHYLQSKGQCLKLISAALAKDRTTQGDKAILIAVVLLTILDIFESGSGTWSLHLEGAKTLVGAGVMAGVSEWDSSARKLLQEAAIFQTFGSSLGKPGALTSASTLPAVWASGSSRITPIGCPVDILSAIEIFASQRRFESIFAAPTTNIQALEDALRLIRSYDIPAWAEHTTRSDPAVPCEDLLHLGMIWKLAADIYACRVLCSSTESATVAFEPPSVHTLRAEYSFLERTHNEVMRCLIWPTFVTGAASTSPDDRAWVLRTLERIWNLGHCANTNNAIQVLEVLWERHDRAQPMEDDHGGWNWIGELSQLKGSWLFV